MSRGPRIHTDTLPRVRCTPGLRELVERAAQRCHMPVTRYVRLAVLEHARGVLGLPQDGAEDDGGMG